MARVTNAAPASTNAGLNVRILSGPSSVADFSVRPIAPSTYGEGGLFRVAQSTAGDLNVTVAGYVAPSTTITVRSSTAADLQAQTQDRPWSTTARSSVTQSSTNVTLQAASTARRAWTCFNKCDTGNASLFVKWGATASTSDFDLVVLSQQYYEMPQPVYVGRIDGVWESTGTGYARIVQGLD